MQMSKNKLSKEIIQCDRKNHKASYKQIKSVYSRQTNILETNKQVSILIITKNSKQIQ